VAVGGGTGVGGGVGSGVVVWAGWGDGAGVEVANWKSDPLLIVGVGVIGVTNDPQASATIRVSAAAARGTLEQCMRLFK
jgi:hypothetical protein